MQEIFKQLIENMKFPVWIKNLELEYTYVNEKFAQLHNKKADRIIGLKAEDLYSLTKAEKFNYFSREIIKSGKGFTENIYVNDEYRECTLIPIKDTDGKVIAIAGVISVRIDKVIIKEKELEIENQKNLTKQIIDILPGVVFCKDREGKYIYANKECREFYAERGIDSIFGKTDPEINPNKALIEKFKADDEKIVKSKSTIYSEAVFEDELGNKTYREVVKIPLLDTIGDVSGIAGRSIDITERKLYQQKLEYLSYTDILTGVKNRACFEEMDKNFSKEKYMPVGIVMGDVNGLKLLNDTFGHLEGDNLLKEMARVLKESCEDKGEVFRLGGDEFVILIPNTSAKDCEEVILRIDEKCNEYENNIFNLSISLGSVLKKSIDEDIYEVLKEAENKVYRKKLLQDKSIKSSILNSLKIGLGVKSEETEEHAHRVAINAVKLGEKLGLEMSELDELRIAAELHDIGKIGISEEILLKKGPLTAEEYEIMKTHSEKGYRVIKASSELKSVAESVLYHHERYDGKGYPIGLKNEEIPLLARIISICDAYDVMISDRVYKKAMNKEDAIKELKRSSGTQFDPMLVEVFISEI